MCHLPWEHICFQFTLDDSAPDDADALVRWLANAQRMVLEALADCICRSTGILLADVVALSQFNIAVLGFQALTVPGTVPVDLALDKGVSLETLAATADRETSCHCAGGALATRRWVAEINALEGDAFHVTGTIGVGETSA